jgi:hypothetical protein
MISCLDHGSKKISEAFIFVNLKDYVFTRKFEGSNYLSLYHISGFPVLGKVILKNKNLTTTVEYSTFVSDFIQSIKVLNYDFVKVYIDVFFSFLTVASLRVF